MESSKSVKSIPPNTENWPTETLTTKTTTMTRALRTSMRPTTAWTTTRATCTSPEHALRARNLCHTLFILSHMHLMAQVWVSSLVIHVHVRLSLSSSLSSSTSTCPSLSSSFPSTSCTSSCTLSSTTWSPCKNLRNSREQGEWRRLWRPHLPHRLWAQLHGLQRGQRLFRFLLLHDPVIGPRHGWRDTRQAAHRGTSEDKPITANQNACQSVSRRRLLCSMDQGNLMERQMSINQLILVSQETRTVLSASFLKTPKLRKWSIDQGNLRSEIAQMHRLGLYLKNRNKWLSPEYCEKIGHLELQAAHAGEELWRQQVEFREVHQQSLTEMEELRKIPKFYIRYARKTKAHRRPEHYFGINRQSTRITKWSKLYERF